MSADWTNPDSTPAAQGQLNSINREWHRLMELERDHLAGRRTLGPEQWAEIQDRKVVLVRARTAIHRSGRRINLRQYGVTE